MHGAISDGVTKLLLRFNVNAPGSVRIKISGTDNIKEDGLLIKPEDINLEADNIRQVGTNEIDIGTTAVNSGNNKAFAIYNAPESFVRNGPFSDSIVSSRFLPLTVEYSSPGCNIPMRREIKIRLERPPVVLVHGLWSSSNSCWGDSGFEQSLKVKFPLLNIIEADYVSTNANYFNDNLLVVEKKGIAVARQELLNNGIAMVQADVVAHSMGGLLARIHAISSDYKNRTNYFKGDIHKLITIDTPHKGSFIADRTMDLIHNPTQWTALAFDPLLRAASSRNMPLDKGAIEDLCTQSDWIKTINQKSLDVPTHAIAGNGIKNNNNQYDNIPLLGEGVIYGCYLYSIPDYPSDLVVSTDSQLAGLAFSATTTADHYHTTATGNPQVISKVIELLNAEVDSSCFQCIPVSGTPATVGLEVVHTSSSNGDSDVNVNSDIKIKFNSKIVAGELEAME
jgi:triacylglycerol esterase/lipase EstA (alpha/beta hydrolase family)